MSRPTHNETKARAGLTERQEEILLAVDWGLTKGEIAQELGITLDGVKWNLREIFSKLDVNSREAAVRAWREERREGHVAALALGWFRWAITGVAALAVAAAAGLIAVALLEDDDSSTAGSNAEPVVGVAIASLGPEDEPSPLRLLESPTGRAHVVDDECRLLRRCALVA